MLAETFQKPKPILGTVQLLPLPGSQDWGGQWEPLMNRAEQEATALASGGADGLIVENTHDGPYGAERLDVAGAMAMAALCRRLAQLTTLPVGVSVLRNDPETALALIANGCAGFIRIPLLSGALITDAGILNSRLNELRRYKALLKTELPPLLIDLSSNHLGPAPLKHLPITETGGQRLSHLIHLAKALPQSIEPHSIVLSDRDINADELAAFKEQTGERVLVENHEGPGTAEACFGEADGLILQAGIRRQNSVGVSAPASGPTIPPAIDMIRVEELINRLRQVTPVSQLDPDVFLRR